MVPNNSDKLYLDPIEELDDSLEHTWQTLCDYFDVGGELPEILCLFNGVNVTMPQQAAEIVVANMLTDMIGNIGRFSPWYIKPARAFGLNAIRDMQTNCIRWLLAPEAIQKWEDVIGVLAELIQRNSGLIQAMLYVEKLMGDAQDEDECVTARCRCLPPHTIRVNKIVLEKMEVYCNVCKYPFV